ncbi:MAG: helix-turn-helix transcriptional regulator [Pseudomonadota bacterium]
MMNHTTNIARSSKQLGNIIQRARKQRDWTQTELAQMAGLRQEMVSKIERGQDGTKLSSVYALLAALDLELVIETRSKVKPEIADVF